MSWPPQRIATPRLYLRPLLPYDAEPLFSGLCADAEVTRYLGWRTHSMLAQTRELISYETHRWTRGAAWTWVLCQAEGSEQGNALGLIQLLPQSEFCLRLGFLLRRASWGQGLMQEAATPLIEQALARPGVYRIEAHCDVDNAASARVLEKLGMQLEGRLQRVILHPNIAASPRDAWLYARTREVAT
ncbi:GNAT family N-acetyltransferase [Uliginosibacterium sediminicola]|uniref:GNAT family N-acetyltransferase n=1 Tax=Uliginosibacterium sediminicola TaxID=2024550 RepID=A0ABU9Z1V1_9RHOO